MAPLKTVAQGAPEWCLSWIRPARRRCCILSREDRMGLILMRACSATRPKTSTALQASAASPAPHPLPVVEWFSRSHLDGRSYMQTGGLMTKTERALAAAIFVLTALGTSPAQAQTYTVLHRFTGADGSYPVGSVIADPAGSLFGTTYYGGANGVGTVFKLDKTGLTVLHSLAWTANGGNPSSNLVRDAAGNLYGTTPMGGGAHNGVVFKLDPAGTETVLDAFKAAPDGRAPWAGLIKDSTGNFYGTAEGGGAFNAGTVYKLDQTGETVLYSFTGGADGQAPHAGLLLDGEGNLYGTTVAGGANGYGVVFKLDTAGTETVLHSFAAGADGAEPDAGVIQDSAGNLYGTTDYGGASGEGVIFKIDTSGNETVLYTFTGGADGGIPGCLILDSAGNLYSTAFEGGAYGFGVVFKLDTTGAETVLYSFAGGKDGLQPSLLGLFRDSAGNLYGTASAGGTFNSACVSGCGLVFELAP